MPFSRLLIDSLFSILKLFTWRSQMPLFGKPSTVKPLISTPSTSGSPGFAGSTRMPWLWPGARQDANLRVRRLALGDQLEGLGDPDGGRARVRLDVVAGHHLDRVARRSRVDRGLDRLSGFDRRSTAAVAAVGVHTTAKPKTRTAQMLTRADFMNLPARASNASSHCTRLLALYGADDGYVKAHIAGARLVDSTPGSAAAYRFTSMRDSAMKNLCVLRTVVSSPLKKPLVLRLAQHERIWSLRSFNFPARPELVEGRRGFFQRAVSVALVVSLSVGFAATASAYNDGIIGASGKDSGFYCSSCHAGGTAPTVAFEGPATMAPGSTATFRFTISSHSASQIAAGLDVAASGGTLGLVAGTGYTLAIQRSDAQPARRRMTSAARRSSSSPGRRRQASGPTRCSGLAVA